MAAIKLSARRAYQGRHRACATPTCTLMAQHRAGTCTPTTAAAELVTDGAR